MTLRIALLLLLCSASLPLVAREVRQAGPNGNGSCPTETESQADETVADGREHRGTSAAPAERPAKPGGTGEAAVRNPRWHSFLPGMFR